jgi:ATP-dependent DNA ligase
MSLPTLYKMDSANKIRTWSIATEGSTYSVSHGVLGGAQQATLVACEGKNIGRANETTGEQQAISEAQGLWNKQKDRKGYTVEIPTTQPNLPMLAHKYKDHSKKVQFPAVVSPKIDGLRLILSVQGGQVTTTSRTGTAFTGLDHITSEYVGLDDIVLDGELYSRTLTFEQISSVVRKGDVNDPRMGSIFFYAFDIINEDTYHQRVIYLDTLVSGLAHTEVVPWYLVNSHEEIETKHKQFLAEGWEGTMVRNIDSLYQKNKRSYDLLKHKSFDDKEFEIIGCRSGVGKFENVPIFELKTDEGFKFEAVPKGDEASRSEYLENADSYIGKFATVKFFGFTNTDSPVPRFPVITNIDRAGT